MLGVGVFTTATFHRGQLLVRYFGETISVEEGSQRQAIRRKSTFLLLLCHFVP